jgi:Family of unknown function (DUF5677)
VALLFLKSEFRTLKDLNKILAMSQLHAAEIYDYVDMHVAQPRKINEQDHFAFVAHSFLHKQVAHARSINLLMEAGLSSDALILSRVMLEGLIYIAWMYEDSDKRARKYRAFALIEDFRKIRDRDKRGLMVTKEQREMVETRLNELGPEYRSKAARSKALSHGDDPFQPSWNYDDQGAKIRISAMAEELGDKNLKPLYDELSQWSHWSIDGIAHNLIRTENAVRITSGNVCDAIRTCKVVAMSLSGTAIALSSHLKLGFETDLQAMRSKLATELGVST